MTSQASLPKPKKPNPDNLQKLSLLRVRPFDGRKPWLFLLRKVLGESMLPTLRPGTVVLGIRPRRLKPGDVVVLRHDGLDKIKRVKALQQDKLFVVGDNPDTSTDSRELGWLPLESVLARVVLPR